MAIGSPRVNFNKLKKKRKKVLKAPKSQILTHQDFMSFVEPFYELLKKKHIDNLNRKTESKKFSLKKDIYTKLSDFLNTKLFGSYVFDKNLDIPDFSNLNPLEIKKPVKFQLEVVDFYEKNLILEDYVSTDLKATYNEYIDQVKRNNERKELLCKIIPERAKMSAYFHLYDLINGKLLDIQKKRVQAKKKYADVDLQKATIVEYLKRIDEFFDVFGSPDQFSSEEMNYADIFDDITKEENDSNLHFLK